MDLGEIKWEGVDWACLGWNEDRGRELVNMY